LLGQSDPPLSDQGRTDAHRIFSGLEVKRVYSSPLRRALETAAFLRSSSEVTVLDDLSEISLGAWDGKCWEEVQRTDPALANRKSEDWFGVTPPDGESWAAFTTRVMKALDLVRGPNARRHCGALGSELSDRRQPAGLFADRVSTSLLRGDRI